MNSSVAYASVGYSMLNTKNAVNDSGKARQKVSPSKTTFFSIATAASSADEPGHKDTDQVYKDA